VASSAGGIARSAPSAKPVTRQTARKAPPSPARRPKAQTKANTASAMPNSQALRRPATRAIRTQAGMPTAAARK
jgi:hypothetical protein